MELQLKIAGILLVLLAGIHISFPKYFNWEQELKPLSLINRQMTYVHTFFIALVILLMGLLCFFCASDITGTSLGKQLALGLFIFWAIRLLFQFFVYSPRLWKGRKFETVVHIVFSMLWVYLAGLFLLIYLAD